MNGWLDRKVLGLTLHHWLASVVSSPSAGAALWFYWAGRVWAGTFFLVLALALRSWVLGEDLVDIDGESR